MARTDVRGYEGYEAATRSTTDARMGTDSAGILAADMMHPQVELTQMVLSSQPIGGSMLSTTVFRLNKTPARNV